jgi:hypothetical protein
MIFSGIYRLENYPEFGPVRALIPRMTHQKWDGEAARLFSSDPCIDQSITQVRPS